jgi:hypothetical protein
MNRWASSTLKNLSNDTRDLLSFESEPHKSGAILTGNEARRDESLNVLGETNRPEPPTTSCEARYPAGSSIEGV